jgi:squalene-hopene/tetraprenyl-beta-curcumene cyclase
MLRKNLSLGCLLTAAMLAAPAFGSETEKAGLDPATKKEALQAIRDGVQWLKSRQKEDGSWMPKQYPAITAMATRAILQDPSRPKDKMDENASKGLAYVASCARPDGGIYCDIPREKGGSQANYNTAAALLALDAAGGAPNDPLALALDGVHETKYEPLVHAARSYLIHTQRLDKDDYYGGWGYDAGRKDPHADMSNTGFAMEALYITSRSSKSSAPQPKPAETATPAAPAKTETQTPEAASDDPNWAAATAFLSHCQNLPSADKDRAVSRLPRDVGGFYYHPNASMAKGELDEDGRQIWHSYGNATALGLECLLEAGVDRTDPRVAETVNWLRANFNLEEHAGGMGKQGLYYYYHTLAWALTMYGEEPLKRADKPAVDWRRAMIEKLVALQRTDPQTGLKYWVNDEGRWMENDPVLVTAYSVLALETLVAEPAASK